MGLTIGLFSAVILFALMAILFGRLHYKNTFGIKYSFRSMFPFELNYKTNIFKNFYCNLSIFLCFACSIAFLITYNFSYNNGYLIFAMIVGTFFAIVTTILFFVPFEYLKFHITLTAFEMIFSFAFIGSIILFCLKNYESSKSLVQLICLIVAAVVFVGQVILLINPKMTMDFKAERIVDENGNEKLIRPKLILLALAEWLSIFAYLIGLLLLLILIF